MRTDATATWVDEHGSPSESCPRLPDLGGDVGPALASMLAGAALGLATVGLWALRFLQVL